MAVASATFDALRLAFAMFWQVLWPLALGFLLSAVVQTLVTKRTMTFALGRDSLRGVALAATFGAASSSCSYAAVSVARTLFSKGASFTNAIVFEFASTNLVFELSLALLALLGWPFLGAELAGGLIMIALIALAFRLTLRPTLVSAAQRQAERRLAGKMEGHGAMDMSITDGPLMSRLFSRKALTAVSHYFYMDLASLWTDLGLGFLIAGALGAWVPKRIWLALFLTHDRVLSQLWGPFIGPLISMLSFVCSVGNIPLAAVLWNGGISFGGVVSFIFADLIILPIVNIHRKYYGGRMSLYLLGVSYVAMALAGLAVELSFSALGLVPTHRTATVLLSQVGWNTTTWLDSAFLAVVVILGWRFLATGGPAMLRTMAMPAGSVPGATQTVRDPVCGMTVDPANAEERRDYQGHTYVFCSAECRAAFERAPERYGKDETTDVGSHGPAVHNH